MLVYPVNSSTVVWKELYRENIYRRWASAVLNYNALDYEVSGDESAREYNQRDFSSCKGDILESIHVLFLENDKVFGKTRKQVSQLDSCNDEF